ncbi:MAG: transcription termination/antitermination protein NusA [Limnochordaceae bacterium]|nr:transcription termination/antitermination protein NusA [Limnochordaceae bacterium]
MPRGKTTSKESPELATFRELEGALGELERERGIPRQRLLDVLKEAVLNAYKKQYGDQAKAIRLTFGPDGIHVFRQRVVVPDPPASQWSDVEPGTPAAEDGEGEITGETTNAPEETAQDEGANAESTNGAVPARAKVPSLKGGEIPLSAARQLNPNYQVGDIVEDELSTREFGRIAAQNAKQKLRDELRKTEDTLVYEEFKNRVGDIVTGVVQRRDRRGVVIDLGRAEALLRPGDQVPHENYQPGTRLKVYVTDVQRTARTPQILVSRSHPDLVKRLFELEVPEIHDGIVEIKGVAREAGQRSKMAVYSRQPGVDPIGACVGPRGQRVQNVVQELHGEKIDIIPWDQSPERFVARALEPAEVERVLLRPAEKLARVVVPDQKLSLAIGRDGQNARLAAKLTGWRIDIKSTSQMAQIVAEELFTPANTTGPAATGTVEQAPVTQEEPAVPPADAPAAAPVVPDLPLPGGTPAPGGVARSQPGPVPPVPPPAVSVEEEENRRRRLREEERLSRRARPRREKEEEVPLAKLLEEEVELESPAPPPAAAEPSPRRERVSSVPPSHTAEQRPLATTLAALLREKGATLPLLRPEDEKPSTLSESEPGKGTSTGEPGQDKDKKKEGKA